VISRYDVSEGKRYQGLEGDLKMPQLKIPPRKIKDMEDVGSLAPSPQAGQNINQENGWR
jgi:hypothetical protein